jgi:hypothetical protein
MGLSIVLLAIRVTKLIQRATARGDVPSRGTKEPLRPLRPERLGYELAAVKRLIGGNPGEIRAESTNFLGLTLQNRKELQIG